MEVNRRERWSYAMGSLGNNLIYGFMASYLMVYYTDYFGVAAAVVGTLFFVARIWDAANDPVMGLIVDNTYTKRGKFRPYLLFMPIVMGLFTILTFTPVSGNTTMKIVWIFVTYIGWGMSFTAMDIPYWSMSAAITQDQSERGDIVMLSRTIATVGYFLAAVFTLPIVKALGDTAKAWQFTAIIFAVIAVICTWITYRNVKERAVTKNEERQGIRHVANMLKVNQPLRLIMVGLFAIETGNAIKTVLPFYYLKYNLNAESSLPLFLGGYALITVLGSILSPQIFGRLGKKKTVLWSLALMVLAGVGQYFAGYSVLTYVMVFTLLSAFAFGVANIALMSMLADTVEYGQWKTGRRTEGMIFSTNIFKTKLASAFGGMLGAFILSRVGYIANAVQTLEALQGIHLAISLLPSLIAVVAFLPFTKYGLTEARYEEILEELKGREESAS